MTLDELQEGVDALVIPSLRDRFAMAALSGVLAQHVGYTDAAVIAREAYAVADAMLLELSSGGAPDDGSPSGTTPVSP
jgi:hypothetical protein